MLLAGLGDLVLMRPLRHLRRPPAGSLLPVVREADLALANLEVPLTAAGASAGEGAGVVLRGDPALVAEVAGLGLGAVSLANNHCGDQGWPALRGLAAALRRAGVAPLGVGESAAAAFEPVALGGIAMVAATCVGPEPHLAAEGRPGLAGLRIATRFEPDAERLASEPGSPPRAAFEIEAEGRGRLLAAVRRARELAPLAVVLMHWGVSHATRPAGYERGLARALVDAGAGVVFGSHAHELQGVEVVAGAPVFYGLGSFVFGYEGPLAPRMPRDTAVALVDVREGRVVRARLLLGRLDAGGEPVRAHPERAALLAEILGRSSAGWGAETVLDRDTLEVAL